MQNEEFDIGDLFANEPEAETQDPPSEAVEGQEQEESPVVEGSSGQESDSAPQAEPEQAETPSSEEPTASEGSEIETLREELRQSQNLLAELQGQFIRQGQAPKAPEKQEPEAPKIPDYMFQIPDEIANGVYSDDPTERKQALAQLVSGIGQSVHQTLQAEFENKLASVQKELPERMSQTVEAQTLREQIRSDFYGNFKELDRPELYPLVKHFTGQVMAEGKYKSWGPELRNEIGKRTKAYLESFGAPKAAASKPPAMTAPQSRPPQKVPGLEDEIAELIDL